jgi:hypothetical protein
MTGHVLYKRNNTWHPATIVSENGNGVSVKVGGTNVITNTVRSKVKNVDPARNGSTGNVRTFRKNQHVMYKNKNGKWEPATIRTIDEAHDSFGIQLPGRQFLRETESARLKSFNTVQPFRVNESVVYKQPAKIIKIDPIARSYTIQFQNGTVRDTVRSRLEKA